MKHMRLQAFIIPNETKYALNLREYIRNQTQLKEAFAAYAAEAGIESRDVKILMYDLQIAPTENDLQKFSLALRKLPAYQAPYYFAHHGSDLYMGWFQFLHTRGLEPYPGMGFRNLSSYKGHDTYFQEFVLDGRHYGCILAPDGFTISEDLTPVTASDYYSMLVRYIAWTGNEPSFMN